MKYLTMLIPFIFVLQGCNRGLMTEAHKSKISTLESECEKYEVFFKRVWSLDKETSIYSLKDDPEWWYEHQYFDTACLNGRTRKDIVNLFGYPSEDFRFVNFSLLTYCMDEECLKPSVNKGRRVQFQIDSTDTVIAVFTSPPIQMRPLGE